MADTTPLVNSGDLVLCQRVIEATSGLSGENVAQRLRGLAALYETLSQAVEAKRADIQVCVVCVKLLEECRSVIHPSNYKVVGETYERLQQAIKVYKEQSASKPEEPAKQEEKLDRIEEVKDEGMVESKDSS